MTDYVANALASLTAGTGGFTIGKTNLRVQNVTAGALARLSPAQQAIICRKYLDNREWQDRLILELLYEAVKLAAKHHWQTEPGELRRYASICAMETCAPAGFKSSESLRAKEYGVSRAAWYNKHRQRFGEIRNLVSELEDRALRQIGRQLRPGKISA